MTHEPIAAALSRHMPSVIRWSGAVARRLRGYNIALGGKSSGSASTDALTLADLTIQELIVAALRDRDPIFRSCKIEAEEVTGDLERFATESKYTLAIDPIDGTKQYRDKTGNGYAVMLHLRSPETVHYSLVFVPERGANGTWVEVIGDRVVTGEDDPTRPAEQVLASFPSVTADRLPPSGKIYLIGFQKRDRECAEMVTKAGLHGFDVDAMPGSIYDLMASGEFIGSLIHSPNIYDFPVSLQIARTLGGDAVWVHNREPVNFREMWLDERANMLRLPGIVACSRDRQVLDTLCNLARDWNPVRYTD
ncbi:MAG: inositol monophosphatase [Planctomycetaceae bacterium]